MIGRNLSKPALMLGFECGLVDQGRHDLLDSTGHVIERKLRHHYRMAKMAGIDRFRDGLVPGHNAVPRIAAAIEERVHVIWDILHYHVLPDDFFTFISRICEGFLRLHPQDITFHVCPVNEAQYAPEHNGYTIDENVEMGLRVMQQMREMLGKRVRFYSSEPYDAPQATNQLAKDVDVIGLNYYPHTHNRPLSLVLIETWRAHRKPLMITETSWHCGNQEHHDRFPHIRTKDRWLEHVKEEVAIAVEAGVPVEGICWYPGVDCPPWHDVTGERWSHGLIKADGSLDPMLSAAILKY